MADRYDEDRWLSRGPAGWDDNRIDNGERERGGRTYNRDRSERGPVARGADEVRSWFGDDDAQRRREDDERRDRMRESREYRSASEDRERGQARGWSRDESRATGIGREWSPYDAQYGWEGGGRTSRHPSYDSYERNDANWRSGHGRDFTERGDRHAYDRFQSGYFDSSMGYPGDQGNTGSLNPFTYRGPGAATSRGSSFQPSSQPSYGGSSGSSYSGRGPKNYQRSDERIREDIVDRLTDDHRVDASDIDVQVRNGEVTLNGHVHDRRMRRAAEECIEELAGVRDVHNNLQVTGGHRGALGQPGAPQERDDVTSLNLTGAQAQAHKDEVNSTNRKS